MTDCQSLNANGGPCKSPALPSGYCYMHDPELAEQAQQARLKGGLNRRVVPIGEYPGRIETVEQLLEFVNRALQEAWNLQEGSERRLRAVTALLRVACDVIPLSDLNARLELLEDLLYGSTNANNKKAN